jgi:hypothetical protein
MPAQLGCCRLAPFAPHLPQRADCRSRSLEALGPHRIIRGTIATASRCRQRSHTTQHHGQSQRSSCRVGAGGWRIPAILEPFAAAEQPRGVVVCPAGSPTCCALRSTLEASSPLAAGGSAQSRATNHQAGLGQRYNPRNTSIGHLKGDLAGCKELQLYVGLSRTAAAVAGKLLLRIGTGLIRPDMRGPHRVAPARPQWVEP